MISDKELKEIRDRCNKLTEAGARDPGCVPRLLDEIENLKQQNTELLKESVENEFSKRFIAVIHSWFVDSYGFQVVELKAKNWEEAQTEKAVLFLKNNKSFSKCAIRVIELHTGEHRPKPGRKLSWGERIFGRVKK